MGEASIAASGQYQPPLRLHDGESTPQGWTAQTDPSRQPEMNQRKGDGRTSGSRREPSLRGVFLPSFSETQREVVGKDPTT